MNGMKNFSPEQYHKRSEIVQKLTKAFIGNTDKGSQNDHRDSYADTSGISKDLRDTINQKYEIQQVIGRGSYGSVHRGVCRATGRPVALKTMVDQTKTEYDCVKMLREIQIMRKLNELSQALHCKTAKSGKVGALKGNVTPKSIFLPELIDIICPTLSKGDQPTGVSASTGGSGPLLNS